ncbi:MULTISPECIES: hypothetical protein [Cysteiniphilum]|uniref:Uncharacterized protein n=1 Tax=Cysteiniphilum litorale TaxID=2056700 RepID=A0A8J2Z5Y0_9GAMM|nr:MULTISPECIES: hypothetical protein [Cysteiniphilum]GGG02898.1 hypothetical protein GCM10010995_20420 [Cysteiniphilum litorale]
MRLFLAIFTIIVTIFINGCSLFPAARVSGHIPPELMEQRLVYGCSSIQNELKLATCYLKTREALYLANQDKQDLAELDRIWSN